MRDHSGFFIALNRKENNIIRVFDVFQGSEDSVQDLRKREALRS